MTAVGSKRPKWTRDGWLGRLRQAVGWCPHPNFGIKTWRGDDVAVLRLGLGGGAP